MELTRKQIKTIAFIGLSPNEHKPSNQVATYFQNEGYTIIPVNPNCDTVLGQKSYPGLLSIPKDIHLDIVAVFRKRKEVLAHLREVVQRGGIETVWLAEGVSSQEAEDYAKDHSLAMVTEMCMLKVHKAEKERRERLP